ncbi:hypothetical protein LCGC14_0629500 [marine sediment metagenome]|uniref:Uncharacterized protein n=1 Tax=marine sediment metagenome TaxID=412755 RepID=A0A0F9R2H7_9ZZZZ
MRKRQLIEVKWDDIAGYKNWRAEDSLNRTSPSKCVTVGWKMQSDRKVLRVASTRSDTGDCVDLEVIPRGCIRSIRRIE